MGIDIPDDEPNCWEKKYLSFVCNPILFVKTHWTRCKTTVQSRDIAIQFCVSWTFCLVVFTKGKHFTTKLLFIFDVRGLFFNHACQNQCLWSFNATGIFEIEQTIRCANHSCQISQKWIHIYLYGSKMVIPNFCTKPSNVVGVLRGWSESPYHSCFTCCGWTSEEKDQHIFPIEVVSHGNPANTSFMEFHQNRFQWKPIRWQQSHNNNLYIFVYTQWEKKKEESTKYFLPKNGAIWGIHRRDHFWEIFDSKFISRSAWQISYFSLIQHGRHGRN